MIAKCYDFQEFLLESQNRPIACSFFLSSALMLDPWEPKGSYLCPQNYQIADRKILGNWHPVVLNILMEVTPKNTCIKENLIELHQFL